MSIENAHKVRHATQEMCDYLAKRALNGDDDPTLRFSNITADAAEVEYQAPSAHAGIALAGIVANLLPALRALPMIDRIGLSIHLFQSGPRDFEAEIAMRDETYAIPMNEAPVFLHGIALRLTDTATTCRDDGPLQAYEVHYICYGEKISQILSATSARQAIRLLAIIMEPTEPLSAVAGRISAVHLVCPQAQWRENNPSWSFET